MNELSIFHPTADKQFDALQKSRLGKLIDDKGLLNRIIEAAVNLLTNDKIRACDEGSVLGALYKAASLGCRLEPEFGEAYLIPRTIKGKQVCCFQLGYKYWKAQALESGNVSFLEAREVYEEDEFSFEYGSGAFIKHIPADHTRGVTTHFYARAKLKDGSEIFEVITKQGAEKSRAHSETQYDYQAGQKIFSTTPKDIWGKHYAAMALRRPIKRICAALPLTAAIEAATQADGSVTYVQNDGQVVTVSPIDVEKSADEPQDHGAVSTEIAEQLQLLADVLQAMNRNEFSKAWADAVNQCDKPTAIVYLTYGLKKCETAADLSWLWDFSKKWVTSPDIKKLFTARKAEITTHGK